eukprot:TRINITY_DN2671_c0_g1_i1.p1 TRINITY_DN2671_c0_g1~~TRINITY_DN2671_c0_g1_i1.p1  ORF type:complete len:135 (-),score=29.10 TRINITY_DN2671_c0_g1_i1:178-582(-)
MGRNRPKRPHNNKRAVYKSKRLHIRKKDLDQIQHDLKPENVSKILAQPIDADLPGLGQFYCIECSRYFVNEISLKEHKESKVHKRRVEELKVPAYTQDDAEWAAGMGKIDNGIRRKPQETAHSQQTAHDTATHE